MSRHTPEAGEIDTGGSMFAAFKKLLEEHPNSPVLESIREDVAFLKPRIVSGLSVQEGEMSLIGGYEKLGRDWYNFRVRGLNKDAGPEQFRNRFQTLGSSPQHTLESGRACWEALARGLELSRPNPNADQKKYTRLMGGGVTRLIAIGKQRADFILHVELLQEDIRPFFFIMALADLETVENLHPLEGFLTSDETKKSIRPVGSRVDYPTFLSTYNEWFVNQRP